MDGVTDGTVSCRAFTRAPFYGMLWYQHMAQMVRRRRCSIPSRTLKLQSKGPTIIEASIDLSSVLAALRPIFTGWIATGEIRPIEHVGDHLLFRHRRSGGLFSVREGEIQRVE